MFVISIFLYFQLVPLFSSFFQIIDILYCQHIVINLINTCIYIYNLNLQKENKKQNQQIKIGKHKLGSEPPASHRATVLEHSLSNSH